MLRRRSICVSVSTLVGIRFMIRISNGLMSWDTARFSVITKTFSDSRVEAAGRSSGIFIGKSIPSVYARTEVFLPTVG